MKLLLLLLLLVVAVELATAVAWLDCSVDDEWVVWKYFWMLLGLLRDRLYPEGEMGGGLLDTCSGDACWEMRGSLSCCCLTESRDPEGTIWNDHGRKWIDTVI